jgi:hypothetical protein
MNLPLDPWPDYGDKFTIEEFVECCRTGLFTNDDGSGYYATAEGVSHIPARPRDMVRDLPLKGFTHIAWFNK